jgi:hypothetical protein
VSSGKVWSPSNEISAFGVCFNEHTFGRVGGMKRVVLTEQRTNIKFLVKLGKNSQEILQMLEMVYGESVMKGRTVYKWVHRFKDGMECGDDDACAGRKSRSKIKTMLIVYSGICSSRSNC